MFKVITLASGEMDDVTERLAVCVHTKPGEEGTGRKKKEGRR